MGNDLAQHRVVLAADDAARRQARIDPYPVSRRLDDIEHRTAGGQEPATGILGVDAGLDGMASHGDVVLCNRQLLPGGDAHLLFDKVDAGHHFGHRVLDLKAGVHLHEEEFVGPVSGDDELDGPAPV